MGLKNQETGDLYIDEIEFGIKIDLFNESISLYNGARSKLLDPIDS